MTLSTKQRHVSSKVTESGRKQFHLFTDVQDLNQQPLEILHKFGNNAASFCYFNATKTM